MKVAFFITEAWERDAIAASDFCAAHVCRFYAHPLSETALPEERDVEAISVFVDSSVTRAVLDAFPALRLVSTRSTGFDHIDLAACKERNITVVNVPTYGSNTVAEHAFALLLSLSKRVFDGYEQVREGRGFNPHALRGFDLAGKVLGVVGTGNIGRCAISIGKGFRMEIRAYDKFPDEAYAAREGIRYVDLDTLLAESDVITLHVPYLPETHHLINRENIRNIKKGAVLINTSRGPVVDTRALVIALHEGILWGAGLDVCEEEHFLKDELRLFQKIENDPERMARLIADHILIDHPHVIVTPHSAFNTHEALRRIIDTTLENLASFARGEPRNVVTAV